MEEQLNFRNLYYQNVKQILESKRIFAKGFTNYYGKEYESLINECMNQMFYHIYKPSEDIMKSEKKKGLNNVLKMKSDILKVLLHGLSSNTNQNILLNTDKPFDEIPDLVAIFGKDFLNHFDWHHLLLCPFFHVNENTSKDNETILRILYPSVPMELSKEILSLALNKILENRVVIENNFSMYQKVSLTQKSFDQESTNEGNLQLVNTLENEKISQEAFNELEKIMELDREHLKITNGFHLTGSKGKHVAISLYSSLHIIFHEINHELTEDILGEIHSKIFFHTFKEKIFSKSIFSESYPSWKNAFEIFNDYIASKSLKSLSKFDIEHWDYLVQESGFYTKFFPLVEVLIESFDFFMRYAIICHRPKMIECVLGSYNFKEYISLFSIFEESEQKEQIDMAVLKAKEIVKKMKLHALSFQPTSYQDVNTYLKELEDKGQKVRILKPSMEKLAKEEKIIQSMINDL